eukprot:6198653-Pleurochrysis_carterae.AAC.1
MSVRNGQTEAARAPLAALRARRPRCTARASRRTGQTEARLHATEQPKAASRALEITMAGQRGAIDGLPRYLIRRKGA